jgi:hypothetical protein
MKMLNRKSKMVSFRLSPDEYRMYRDACEVHGIETISELARKAMQQLAASVNGPGVMPHGSLDEQVRDLRQRITHLQEEVNLLSQRVGDGGAA